MSVAKRQLLDTTPILYHAGIVSHGNWQQPVLTHWHHTALPRFVLYWMTILVFFFFFAQLAHRQG